MIGKVKTWSISKALCHTTIHINAKTLEMGMSIRQELQFDEVKNKNKRHITSSQENKTNIWDIWRYVREQRSFFNSFPKTPVRDVHNGQRGQCDSTLRALLSVLWLWIITVKFQNLVVDHITSDGKWVEIWICPNIRVRDRVAGGVRVKIIAKVQI